MTPSRTLCSWFSLSIACAGAPALARAQQAPEAPAPAVEPAAAPALERKTEMARELFERGKAQWLEGQYDAATALFAASVEQHAVPSTLALLADCYEHAGRLKSASDMFHRAAELAAQKGNEALARSASTREAALGPRIPLLEIRVAPPAPAGLAITLDGVEVPAAQLGAPMPMDAGFYQLEARAPGFVPALSSVRLSNDRAQPGPQLAYVALEPEPRVPPASVVPSSAREVPAGAGERREIGWWLGVGGAAALLTSGVVMLVSWTQYSDSRAVCKAATGSSRECPKDAFEQRNTALQLAGVATGVGLTGAALLGTGLTLYLMPVAAPEAVAPAGAGLGLSGAF